MVTKKEKNMNRICEQTRRLLPVALTAIILSGCFSEPDSRMDKMKAIARWEDQRLAPQDSQEVVRTLR